MISKLCNANFATVARKYGGARFLTSSPFVDRPVYIRGVGMSPVSRKSNSKSRDEDDTFEGLTQHAIEEALKDANIEAGEIDAIVVANMLSPVLQKQSQLASLIASRNNLHMLDSSTVDSACGSGGAALRHGIMGVLSGLHRNVLVVGVEILTGSEIDGSSVTAALAQASDMEHEGHQGATFMSLNDDLMNLYIETYGTAIDPQDFFYFAENAHNNALHNPYAVLRKAINKDSYATARKLGRSVTLLDACPTANGAAAVVLSSQGSKGEHVRVLGSDCRTDVLHVGHRSNPLDMEALRVSTQSALTQANKRIDDVDVYEVHDAYTIMSALSLEACGFVPRGKSLELARDGAFGIDGKLPISTFGGLKARGHPVGATGVYQICELTHQLRNTAPSALQVKDARIGLTSSFGGAATTVVTHVLGM